MSLTSIDIGLKDLLLDPVRRQEFFKAIVQDEIASQIRALRKKRDMNQHDLAHGAGMKQSAVSRIEQADYSSWTLTTLLRVAVALDARWRMILEPAEDAIKEYDFLETDNNGPATETTVNALRAFAEGSGQQIQPPTFPRAARSLGCVAAPLREQFGALHT